MYNCAHLQRHGRSSPEYLPLKIGWNGAGSRANFTCIPMGCRSTVSLRFRTHPTKGRWQAWGQCTSGRKVKVEMHLDAQEMHWLRIEYPEYRFLHIFAIDADQMDEALGRTTIPEIMVSSDFNLLIRQQMRGRLCSGKRE